MKKIILGFLLFGSLANGCKKNSPITPAPEQAPTAAFKITNLVSNGMILEGNIADFDNQSTNAVSYKWDFGNGMISTNRIPSNISFVPCGGHYAISLTVTNKSGVSANYSQTFEILCRGKHAHNTPVVHLPTTQIPAYVQNNE